MPCQSLNKKSILDIDLDNKKVIMRVDFNVPIENKIIIDDTKIAAAIPTLNYLLQHQCRVILLSHMGRPKGEKNLEFSLAPAAERLGRLIDKKVLFVPDCIGQAPQKVAADMKPGDVILLENVRFYPEEEKNDTEFAKKLASLAELYVNDAFGTAHRAHASTEAIAHFLPAVGGLLMNKEIKGLANALKENPARPYVAIIGGKKVKDKIPVLIQMLERVDTLLIGGGMSNTFLAARGYQMQKSLMEPEYVDMITEMMAKPEGKRLVLPVDLVVAKEIAEGVETKIVTCDQVPTDYIALDIGPQTVELFAKIIAKAKTVFCNGPMGVFEHKEFANGTYEVMKAIADCPGFTIVGGGDSVSAVNHMSLADKIDHISTGGGASLELLEGKILPGIAALMDQ